MCVIRPVKRGQRQYQAMKHHELCCGAPSFVTDSTLLGSACHYASRESPIFALIHRIPDHPKAHRPSFASRCAFAHLGDLYAHLPLSLSLSLLPDLAYPDKAPLYLLR